MASKLSQSKSTRKHKHKIMLVDDHAVFREGLALIIQQEKDLGVCGEFEDAATALKEAAILKPDMAIIDISLLGMNGVDLAKSLRARFPGMRLLILSMHKEFLYAERALRAGANGYIMKQQTRRELMNAIRCVLRGETYVSDAIKEHILQTLSAHPDHQTTSSVDRLSDRELEIYRMIGQGFGTRQVADQLHISMKTVEFHRENIRAKLNLTNTFELVQHAIHWTHDEKKSH